MFPKMKSAICCALIYEKNIRFSKNHKRLQKIFALSQPRIFTRGLLIRLIDIHFKNVPGKELMNKTWRGLTRMDLRWKPGKEFKSMNNPLLVIIICNREIVYYRHDDSVFNFLFRVNSSNKKPTQLLHSDLSTKLSTPEKSAGN